MAKKEVNARKRDDEETKEEMKRIEAVGKAVKKATRKDKGKLGELVESIKNSNPTKKNQNKTKKHTHTHTEIDTDTHKQGRTCIPAQVCVGLCIR